LIHGAFSQLRVLWRNWELFLFIRPDNDVRGSDNVKRCDLPRGRWFQDPSTANSNHVATDTDRGQADPAKPASLRQHAPGLCENCLGQIRTRDWKFVQFFKKLSETILIIRVIFAMHGIPLLRRRL
jgi:hypothetical protein